MSFFSGLFQLFGRKADQNKVLLESDIKFSALIQNIQNNIVQANESLECVGLKYIEQFFDKEPTRDTTKVINHKFSAIESVLESGDTDTASKLLLDLKADVNGLNEHSTGKAANYRPKMMSFEMPVLKNGVWVTEEMTMPLLALSPVQLPKIKELTFTSTLQNIQHEGEDVYVRLIKEHGNENKKKKLADENVTELKISIGSEQSAAELNDVIAHYEQILRSNETHI
ncbi:hypothetical protein AAD001_08475 [Colwelliaceae bacterium 6471]